MRLLFYLCIIGFSSFVGGALFAGTVLYRSGLVAGPAIVAFAALLLLQQRLVGKDAFVFFAGSMAAGAYGLIVEWQRWQGGGPYSLSVILGGLDVPLVCVSIFALLAPFASSLPRLALNPRRGIRATKDPFGSARWMPLKQAQRVFSGGTLIIGAAYDAANPGPDNGDTAPLLTYSGDAHLLTIGGSGSGKTRTVVRPNCLFWRGPMVVLDPKGDLGRDCGPARQRLGHRVLILNPHDPATDAINVLDWLDPRQENLVLDAESVVSWLLDGQDSGGANAVFVGQARILIHGALVDMMCDPTLGPQSKTLMTLYSRLEGASLGQTITEMEARPPSYGYGIPCSVGSSFNQLRDVPETWQGVVIYVNAAISFLRAGGAARMLSGVGRQSIRTADILTGTIDVFIAVPLRTLMSTPSIARLVLGSLLNAVYGQLDLPRDQRREVLFLLDEMPRLGAMSLLEVARDAGREAGVRLWAIVQDLGQLKKSYGETGLTSWLSSSGVQTYIGINDNETAQRLADAIGQRTVDVASRGSSQNRGPSGILTVQQGTNISTGQAGAYLITPAQIRQMATDKANLPDEQIVLVRNMEPLRCGVVRADKRVDLLR